MLAQDIVGMMPRHTCYVEVFGGAGHVLFAKDPSKVEVYNDINSWLVNFYDIVRNQPERLIERLELTPYSRELYERARIQYANSLHGLPGEVTDPVERAVLFFVLVRQSFNSVVANTWSYSPYVNKGSAWRNAMSLIAPAHNRLREVVIENVSWNSLFTRYDGQDTIFYLDPPYVHMTREESSTGAYEFEFSDEDHINLCWQSTQLQGMVIMSGYMNDIYQDILVNDNGWSYKTIEVTASSSFIKGVNSKPKRVEVLWWNDAVERQASQLVMF